MIYLYILYPYLYVLIPILFLYKTNIYEVRISQLITYTSIITLVYAILYALLIRSFPIYKASFIIFNIFIYLYNFKRIIYHAIIKPITKIKKVAFFQWLFASIMLAFTYFSIFYNFDIKIIDLFVKIMFGILLFINIVILFNIIITNKNINNISANDNNESDIEDIVPENSESNNPNIYFIVPDTYPGWEILKEYANFDNKDFLDFLKENNFNIIENSFSNYRNTSISLPSILNMNYLDQFSQKNEDGTLAFHNLYKGIYYNYLYKYLIKKNYKVTELLPSWEKDMRFFSKYKSVNTIFLKKNSFSFISKLFSDGILIDSIFNGIAGKRIVDESVAVLKYFKKTKISNYNNFIMAHMMLPHPPFVFDDKLRFSSIMALKCGDGKKSNSELENTQNMINQIKYTNNLLKKIIKKILSNDKESIIIIQSDHANYMSSFIGKKNNDAKNYDKTHYNILRVIYYKGEKININSNTAVNTFRELFNILFKDKLEILPEKAIVNEPMKHAGEYNTELYEINIKDL